MNVLELNKVIQSKVATNGNPLVIENQEITMYFDEKENAFHPINLKYGKHVEFKNCTFTGMLAFVLNEKSEIRFVNNNFNVHQFDFVDCKESNVQFFGKNEFSEFPNIKKCRDFYFSIGNNTETIVHQKMIAGKVIPGWKQMLVSNSDNIQLYFSDNSIETLQTWESSFKRLSINQSNIKFLQIRDCSIGQLRLHNADVTSLRFEDSKFSKSDMTWKQLKNISIREHRFNKGINSNSLFCLASQFKKSGDLSLFTNLYNQAYKARYYEKVNLLKKSITSEKNMFSLLTPWIKHAVYVIEDMILNFILRRFYSPSRILLFGLAIVLLFSTIFYSNSDSIIYNTQTSMFVEGSKTLTSFDPALRKGHSQKDSSQKNQNDKSNLVIHVPDRPIITKENPLEINLKDAFYFSAITFCTVGYGDVKPLGWMRFIAALEGFLGILFAATLSVVISRRYA